VGNAPGAGRLRQTVRVSEGQRRLWAPPWPVDVFAVVGGLHLGRGDPTFRRDPDGTIWRGIRTPQGASTLRLGLVAGSGIEATAWGPGAHWVLASVPAMLGDLDDATGFVAHHQPVAEAAKRFRGWRVPRTALVLEALMPAILAQKVTGQEASGSYRALVRRYGERAPGQGGPRGLWVAPSARGWALIPSWEWLRAGVDGARSAAAVRAAGAAGRLEQCVDLTRDQADRRLRALPGIGVWTAAEVRHTALGDPDAFSFGDYHLAKDIGWALTGSEVDDDAVAELLEPYAGHRYRVQGLLKLAGAGRARHGPRMPARTHLPHRFR
jgi:3-methyladenine DNA glycosylase/8-oxoguanine DNA glycosylase